MIADEVSKLKRCNYLVREVALNAEVLKGLIPSVLLFVSYALILLSRINPVMVHFCIFVQIIVAGATHLYIYCRLSRIRAYKKTIKYLLLYFIILMVNLLLVDNITFKMILYAVMIMPSISLLIFFSRIKTKWLYAIFFFAVCFIGVRWIQVHDLNLLTVNSRNYLSFYLVIYALPYYFYCYKNNELPNIIFPVMTVVVSFMAISRGGIVISLILLTGWLVDYLSKTKHKYLVICIIAITMSYIVVISVPSNFVNRFFSRFATEGFKSPVRNKLYVEYISSLKNIPNLLFGTNLDSLPLIAFWGSSVHNSYLYSHARMGIFSVLYIYMIIGGFVSVYRTKNCFFTFYFIAVLVKAFIDSDFPGTPVGGDIYVYLLMLIMFSYRQVRSQRKMNQTEAVQNLVCDNN